MSLKFSYTWQESPYQDKDPRHWHPTFAELEIWVNKACITRNYGEKRQTVKKSTLLPLYELAEWLCLHWWHLFHETNAGHEDYAQRHVLSMAGGGFPLPALQIWPVGDAIRLKTAPYQPKATSITFLEGVKTWEAKEDVQQAFTELIESVIGRLNETGCNETFLHQLWEHLHSLSEEETRFMKALAHLGAHLEEIGDETARVIDELVQKFGYASAIELLAVSQPERLQENFSALQQALQGVKLEVNTSLQPDWLLAAKQKLPQISKPWERGYFLAEEVRNQLFTRLQVGEQALKELANSLDMPLHPSQLDTFPRGVDGISADEQNGEIHLLFPKRHPGSQKFHQGRLIGEYLMNGCSAVHFATRTELPTQQANRAFAAEILLPEEYLRSKLLPGNDVLEEEQLEDIALEHKLSDWMVRLHAFNKNLFPIKDAHPNVQSNLLEFWGSY